jgi:hypothetical protein
VAGSGAAAKGNTFLNAAGVRPQDLPAVAGRAPSKQGSLLRGRHIPVVLPEALLALAPDDILTLPWNIAPEIVAQLRGMGLAGALWTAVPATERRRWTCTPPPCPA